MSYKYYVKYLITISKISYKLVLCKMSHMPIAICLYKATCTCIYEYYNSINIYDDQHGGGVDDN